MPNRIRLGALAAMISGVLFAVGPVFWHLQQLAGRDQPSLFALAGLSLIAALLLAAVGMEGFRALHPHLSAWLVIAGSLATALGGTVFFTLGEAGDFLQASPPLGWVVSGLSVGLTGLVCMAVGFALYGIVILRSGALPRWCGAAFVAAMPAALVAGVVLAPWFVLGFAVFGIAWLALGYALWREAPAAQQFRQVR